jgi:hypothetical protein
MHVHLHMPMPVSLGVICALYFLVKIIGAYVHDNLRFKNACRYMGLVLLYVVPLFQSMNNIAQRHI